MCRFNVFSILAVIVGCAFTSVNSEDFPESNLFNEKFFHQSLSRFHDFTNDFLRESFSRAEFEGAHVVFPLGVAHLLAAINAQKFWNINTNGVDYALWTSKENLTEEYSSLLSVVSKQNSLRGVITSWKDYIGNSEALQKLNVKVENKAGLQRVNQANQIKFHLSSWDNSQRNNAGSPYRKALFASTMFMPNYWLKELVAVGRGVFNGEVNTRFLESKGYIRNQETEDFIAVSLPLATYGQNLVLVLPKRNLADIITKKNLQHFIQYPPKSSKWTFSAVRVYVPSLNFISPGNFYKPLAKLGVHHLMCNPETETQLQPINQANYVYLGTDGFDILTITSADLINVTEYKILNNIIKQETGQRARTRRSNVDEISELFKELAMVNPLFGSEGSFDKDLLVWAAYDERNPTADSDYRTIAFNQPFYWYLHDEKIGPSAAGIVESISQIPKTYYEEPFTRKSFNEWIKDMDATYEVPKCS